MNKPRVRKFINKFKEPSQEGALLISPENNASDSSSANNGSPLLWDERPAKCWDPINGTQTEQTETASSENKSDMQNPPMMRGGGPIKQIHTLSRKTKEGFRKVKERVGARLLEKVRMRHSVEASSSITLDLGAGRPKPREIPARKPTSMDQKHTKTDSKQASMHSAHSSTSNGFRTSTQPQFADSFKLTDAKLRIEFNVTERTYTFPIAQHPAFNERAGFIADFLRRRHFGNPLVLQERRTISL